MSILPGLVGQGNFFVSPTFCSEFHWRVVFPLSFQLSHDVFLPFLHFLHFSLIIRLGFCVVQCSVVQSYFREDKMWPGENGRCVSSIDELIEQPPGRPFFLFFFIPAGLAVVWLERRSRGSGLTQFDLVHRALDITVLGSPRCAVVVAVRCSRCCCCLLRELEQVLGGNLIQLYTPLFFPRFTHTHTHTHLECVVAGCCCFVCLFLLRPCVNYVIRSGHRLGSG